MLASSFMDPVLGVDVHYELVPTPALVPTPIPNPFTGIVFDPLGLAAGIAIGAAIGAVTGAPFTGPVIYWSAFPATNTGTEAKHVPGHILIPPGTMWAPFPKTPKPVIHPGETPKPPNPIKPENDAVMITGSKTVSVMGSNACRIGDIALSCSEPLRLPSSVVLAVPKGAPILIGGPPSLDLMAAAMASLRTRFVSDSLHALLSRLKPGRFRSLLKRTVCFFTGHPVDVASGKVMTDALDASLPGPMPLRIERVYSSAFASRRGPLGHGWSLSLDQAIWRERGKVVLLEEDGREVEFDTFDLPDHEMSVGDSVRQPIDRLRLSCLTEGRWEVESAEGTVREFSPVLGRADGRAMIKRIRTPNGHHEISFSYDDRGRLEWVRDSAGRTIGLEYDTRDRCVTLKLPSPDGSQHYVHRRYIYNEEDDLVEVVDALRESWRFEYFTHLLTRETDRNGLSFYFIYDGIGEDAWCVRTWGDGGIYDHSIAYDKQNRVTAVANSLGETTIYSMNVAGLVTRVVDPLSNRTEYEYDPRTLQLTKVIDELGAELVQRYDDRGNLVELRPPTGGSLTWKYNERDQLISAVDACGGQWRWAYNLEHDLADVRDPVEAETRYQYQGGRLAAVVGPDGDVTRFAYDSHGNVAEITAPDGGVRRWSYDSLGNTLEVMDPSGARQTRRVDLEGRMVAVGEPDGNLRRFTYDAEGRVVGLEDRHHAVRFVHAGRKCLIRREEAGEILRFDYDTEERPLAIVNAAGARHSFVRNVRGDVIEETNFGGFVHRYERDACGRMAVHHKPSGRTVRYSYDPAGHVAVVDYGDGQMETFVYRPDGELVGAANDDVVVVLERDARGRVTREAQNEHWVDVRHDASGLRVWSQTSLGAEQWVERNSMGDVVRLDQRGASATGQAGTWSAALTRNMAGQATSWNLPGSLLRRWEFDGVGRPVEHSVSSGGVAPLWQRFAFDVNERLIKMADTEGMVATFRHDALGNLVAVEDADGAVRGRYVDAAGNIFARPDHSDRQYDDSGRTLKLQVPLGLVRNQYDEDGNLVQRDTPTGAWRYHWDGAGRMTCIEPPEGDSIHFSYDALGRRHSKRQGSEVTRWVWDQDNPVHELWGDGEIVTWVFEPDSVTPIAKLRDEEAWSIIGDAVGAPVAMFDQNGRLTWRANLDIWGQLFVALGERDDCPFRWPGQYEDVETGLYYNRFRYYDPLVGGYVSSDPLGRRAGLSDFGYVPDPLRWLDPLGLIILYHYTNEAGMNGIVNSSEIRPSTAPKNTKFGMGQYFTDIPPSRVVGRTLKDLSAADKAAGNMSLGQLAKELYGDTRRISTCAHYVAVELDDSAVKFCRPGTWVINNTGNLDVKGKITDHGKTC